VDFHLKALTTIRIARMKALAARWRGTPP
jgi:hypothetical protein